ncbi:MAG TPA: YfhO family protein [Caldilineaceae bacterium]|nr:YfhO family protein [Caldilineaceae bacterium]
MNRWPRLFPFGLLLLILFLFLWPALTGRRILLPADIPYAGDPLWRALAPVSFTGPANPVLADQINEFYLWHAYARQLLRAGDIPLWNPYINAGQPFLGNGQAGVFSPFNLVRLLLPLPTSYGWVAFLRLTLAGVFMALYARTIGLQWAGALLSAIAFTLSGPMVVWLGFPHPMVWLPAMLYTGERLLATRSRRWLVACAAVVGAQLLDGHPEMSFQVTGIWLIYLVVRAFSFPVSFPADIRPVRRLVPVLLATTLGLLLAGIHFLPFLDSLPDSMALAKRLDETHVAETEWRRRLLFDYHEWGTALTLLLPRFFGTEAGDSYWYPYSNSVEQTLYAGVLPLALAMAMALYTLRVRTTPNRNLLLLWLGLGAGSLAVGLRLPLANAVNLLPPFSLVAPGRLRAIVVLAVAVLAGAGLDHWLAASGRIRHWVSRLLLLFALATLGLAAAAFAGFVAFEEQLLRAGRAFMEANWGTPHFTQPLSYYYDLVVQRQAAKLALYNPLRTPVMFLPVLVALVWAISRRLAPQYQASIALVLVAVDLFWVGYGFNAAVAPEFLEQKPPLVAHLEADPALFRVLATGTILDPNSAMRYRLHDVRGYDPMALRRYTELLARLPGYYPIHFHNFFTEANAPLLDLLNVKYLLTEQTQSGERWELLDQDGSVLLYRNRNVWPRAFLVYQAIYTHSAEESLARLLDPTFDFRRQVILEGRPPDWVEPVQPPMTIPEAKILAYTPNKVQVHVETPVSGLLVLTDTFMDGWQAWLNDEPTPIWVANHAFRAVVVPAGSHTIAFAYLPRSVYLGAIVSAGAGITLVILALWSLFRRLRHRQES